MADARSIKRSLVDTKRRVQQTAGENKRLSKLVADIPFEKIVVLQEIWKRQRQAIQPHRLTNSENRS